MAVVCQAHIGNMSYKSGNVRYDEVEDKARVRNEWERYEI
jgi:sulfatase maturation enzyme AslB (radical SAM superfamily)